MKYTKMSTRIKGGNVAFVAVVLIVLVFATLRFRSGRGSNPLPDTSQIQPVPIPLRQSTTQARPLLPAAEIQRIRAIADRTDRMKAIFESLPPERQWPDQLPYGFKWVKDAAHSNKITPEMSNVEAENEFYKFIERYTITCPHKERFGSAGGGGWDVCFTPPYNFSKPCLVYSVGMGGEWSFDRDIMNRTQCADMAFDPTLGKDNHKPYNLMWFHNLGMDGINGVNSRKWNVRTFGGMLEEIGHTQAIVDILKVDIEYSEWAAFESMFLEGSYVNVKQFMFEFHTDELVNKDTMAKDFTYFWYMWKALDRLGFKYWSYETNKDGRYKSKATNETRPCCGNVHFVNANLLVS